MSVEDDVKEIKQELRQLTIVYETQELALAAQAKAIFDLQAQVVKLMGEMLTALRPSR